MLLILRFPVVDRLLSSNVIFLDESIIFPSVKSKLPIELPDWVLICPLKLLPCNTLRVLHSISVLDLSFVL